MTNSAKPSNQVTHEDGIKLETRTTCDIEGVDDTWDTSKMDVQEEIEDAIQTVTDDHDEKIIVRGESVWMFEVYWNENTDSIWVSRFGYNGGMEVTK